MLSLTSPHSEIFENVAGIRQRTCEAIELRDDQCVAAAARGERLAQTRTLPIGPGQTVVDVRALSANAERRQRIALRGELLIVR